MHKNKLPKYFLFVDKYEKNILKNDITNLGIIYRNYSKKQNENDIYKLKLYCNKKKFKFYISNNLRLAIKFKTDGIYIPSFNKRITLNKATLSKNFKIIGSAHNHMEVRKKIEQGCKIIFLSPLFKTYKSKYLDIPKFNLIKISFKNKFVALGGINQKNIQKIKMLNIYGISGISMYKKKPAFFKAGFNK